MFLGVASVINSSIIDIYTLKAACNGDVIGQNLNLWCLIRAGLVGSRTSIGYG